MKFFQEEPVKQELTLGLLVGFCVNRRYESTVMCSHTNTQRTNTATRETRQKCGNDRKKKTLSAMMISKCFNMLWGGEMYVNLYFFGEGRQIDGLPRVRTR